MSGWVLTHKGLDWKCRTEQDALGVICYLRDYGRQPLQRIEVVPEPSKEMARLLATLPGQEAVLL